MFAVASLLMTLGVITSVAWLIHRAFEEMNARMNHVCWIDDTLCRDCADYASYAEFRDRVKG